jgi:hypothetical protein
MTLRWNARVKHRIRSLDRSGCDAATLATAVLLLAGCATPHSEWKPAGYYVTDQRAYGCDSFEGAKGTVMKQTAILSLSLQRSLLGLLDQAASKDPDLRKELDDHRDQLMCWYETPEKNVELSLGAFCDSPFEIEFRLRGGEWRLSSAARAIVHCSRRRR